MIDHIDLAIIRILRENARAQWKQIGEQIHMTGAAVANRIQRLEELGIIEGYTIKVNEQRLGNGMCVFVTVMMKDYKHTKFQDFIKGLEPIKEAHRVSGEPCFLLKIHVADHHELSVLLDKILEFGHYKINISIGQVV